MAATGNRFDLVRAWGGMATSKPREDSPDIAAEVQSLAKDVARDALAAARISLRLAERLGREGLDWAEKTADRVLKDRK